jgi:tetratricopeptide (TPR) repeat protein
MPTTVNGIGTHYYGKKDRSTRVAPCRMCGRTGALESYNTRLWFVVVFIPVIPLGRKRIIDACPSCGRHMAADADKYEQARQLQTSGSLERYRREGTPESALEAHAQLLSFHEHEQAAELRGQVIGRFPDDARLRAVLAEHMRQVSSFDEMARLNEEALAMEPDLPEARAGVAIWKTAHGELDEARRLLDFLEEPGAGRQYDLGPLYELARRLQGAGRHEEALELASVLLREVPHLGQDHAFRDLVRRSEKALRREESLLPPRRFSPGGLLRSEGSPYSGRQRKLALFAAALVLGGIGLFVSNEYIRRHRVLRVVNACGAPVQVRVDDGPAVTVETTGEIPVSEGRHRVALSGPVEESRDIELTSGFFERWTRSPLWVVNPGGEAVLDRVTVIYAANPQDAEQELLVGEPFLAFPHVDYPFTDPPQQIQVEGRNTVVTKVAVQWVRGQDLAVYHEVASGNQSKALDFAERRLRREPLDEGLMEAYARHVFMADRPRAEAFFRAGLGRKPLSISWHRIYQTLADHEGGKAGLVAEYDALLAKEPTSGAMLYLRGRVDPDVDRGVEYFRKAVAADPELPWPVMALGMRAVTQGRWEEGLRDLNRARELKMDEDELSLPIHTARMALGQADSLIEEYRPQLVANPTEPGLVIRLFDALAAAGQADAIEPAFRDWEARLPAPIRGELGQAVRGFALYIAGHPEQIDQLEGRPGDPGYALIRAQARAATGHADGAAGDPANTEIQDPWTIAAVSLALALEGEADESAAWRENACEALRARTEEDRKAAEFLRSDTPPPLEQIDRVYFRPGEKALLLAALSVRFPERRDEYREAAARFNVLRLPPYLLVRRAIEGEPPAKP